MRSTALALLVVLSAAPTAQPGAAQPEGQTALDVFLKWRGAARPVEESFNTSLEAYRDKLTSDGLPAPTVERTLRLIVAHDEAVLYDKVYAGPPEFNTKPNQLLVDAVAGITPGTALDVGMGQGRNAVFLASQGWDVTGFDVAAVGLAQARDLALSLGLTIQAVHASDEEFDFGRNRWDLIAIIYAIEKRSVHRVRDALRPGGLVVIEAGFNDAPEAAFGVGADELLTIFKGFRILRHEDTRDAYDWGPETIRLFRLVAQKPRE